MKVYDYKSVENYINTKLVPVGYEIIRVEGSLVDSYICIAPNENWYHIIFREQYLNSWSSALTMRRCRKLTKWAKEQIERIENEQEEAM